jgi:glutamate synthase domain-containing protein 3
VIQGARGIRSMVCEYQVSGMIILHRNKFSIFGQGRYGGVVQGFKGFFW